MADIEYKPSKTGSEFLDDDSFFRGIVGPIGCLAGETLIVTEQGPRRIDSLDAPTKVLSWCARTRKYVFTLASPAFIKGNSALYHVRTPYGEWRAAGHHRVLCREGVYARVDTLLRGRELQLHPPFETVTESKGVVGNVLSSITKVVLLCAGVVRGGAIKSVEAERFRSDYWDVQVPDTNNYVTVDGTVHHNSGKSVLCAITMMQMSHDVPPDLQGRRRSRVAVVRNCYSADTEIFTRRGWVLFPDLRLDDGVAALHGDKVKWEVPTLHYTAPYCGDMITIEQQHINLHVTPEHNLFVSQRRTRKKVWGPHELRKAHEIEGIGELYRMRNKAKFPSGKTHKSRAWFRFLGLWFADGCAGIYPRGHIAPHMRLVISKRESKYIRDCLNAVGFTYTVQPHTDNPTCFNYVISIREKWVKRIIEQLVTYGQARTKRVPRYVMEAPVECRQEFLDGFHYGDGSGGDKKTKERQAKCYHSVCEGLIDDLHELLVLCGGAGDKWRDESADMWGLTELTEGRSHPTIMKQHWGRAKYAGRVYCVEVSSHIVLVRRRGVAVWCGQTYRELFDTTLNTIFEWFPQHDERNGFSWHESSMTWTVTNPQTKFQTEWLFRALDRPDHVRKLLSLELTFAWLNEAREIPEALVHMLQGRLGRFPPMKDYGWSTDPEVVAALLTRMNETGYVPVVGVDVPYWYGMLGDTNPCDVDHWWYKQFEEARPAGWKVFHQPGATSPNAENLENLHPLYYHRLGQGKTEDWKKIYISGEYGFVQSGRPVYPEYSDSIHTIDDIKPDPNVPVVLGGDGGLTPACVFLQNFGGNWIVLDEFVCERLGAVNFGREVRKILDTTFRGCTIGDAWFDPSGGKGSSMIDENETVIEILNDMGVPFQPSPDASNGETRRREAVASVLTTLGIDGKPRLRVCRRASHLRKGLAGAFHYRRLQVAGVERFKDSRDKNQYSHVCFVAGTMVSTPQGRRDIKDLRVGDMVSTPMGPKPITNTQSRRAGVVDAGFATGTPDHPVWTQRGYVCAGALLSDDELATETHKWSSHWMSNTRTHGRWAGTEPLRMEVVYALSVRAAQAFYANGVLVSNCEALEYALVGSGEGFELADRPEIVSGHNRQYTSPRVRRGMGRN